MKTLLIIAALFAAKQAPKPAIKMDPACAAGCRQTQAAEHQAFAKTAKRGGLKHEWVAIQKRFYACRAKCVSPKPKPKKEVRR